MAASLDVNKVLDEVGVGKYHYLQMLMVGALTLLDGAEILVSSSILATLQEVWGLTAEMKGFMMSMVFIGVFTGNFLGGSMADSYGRRPLTLAAFIGVVIFGLLSAACANPLQLLVCRFLFGTSFGAGISPSVALLVESAPSSWRGHLVNLNGIFFALGEVFVALLLLVFMPEIKGEDAAKHWRTVLALSVLPGVILLPFTYMLMLESPHFLMTKGQVAEARSVLRTIATMNGKDDVARSLEESTPPPMAAPAASSSSAGPGAEGLLQSTGGTGDSSCQPSSPTSIENLSFWERVQVSFGPRFRSIVLGGAFICFLANFFYYGLTYSLPLIFSDASVPVSPAFQVLIVSFCDLPGVALAFVLIQSQDFGHRDSLAILAFTGSVLMISMMTLDQGPGAMWLALPSAYLAKYVSQALFVLAYVYLAEVFPASIRTTALALCMSCGRFGSILAPPIFEETTYLDSNNHRVFFAIVSLLCLLGVAVVRTAFYFELKNEPLENMANKPEDAKQETTSAKETSESNKGNSGSTSSNSQLDKQTELC